MGGVSKTEKWLSLVDYAAKTGISVSTLRRHIKANKIQYRLEKGRYLILDENPGVLDGKTRIPEGANGLQEELRLVRSDLKRAREEIAELKTLIAFYEEKISSPFEARR